MIVSKPKHSLLSKEKVDDFNYTPDITLELSIDTDLHSFVIVNKATWSKLLAVLSIGSPKGKNL